MERSVKGPVKKPAKKLVLLGGGGHCKVVLEVLEKLGDYEVHGVSDLPERVSQQILTGYKIDMVDSDLEVLYPKVKYAFVSHGESLDLRRRLFGLARGIGYDLPALVSPEALVSAYSQVGYGTLVMSHVVINPSSKIGSNVILNTGAIVEHDAEIGDHSHIGPGAVLCGRVHVGEMTLVGANSVIIPGVRVGDNVVLGAGSVVVRDVPDNVSMAGNPARVIRPRPLK